ncbi:hypothetical protein [Nostoc sp. NMS4]|uniref:hypothetical protein n=1 Tax=Nostoc sp. NMS4 TaxID=2815390 RepID=UPI0025FF7083|nr:hypothetical protein [Nostoc sp. NMS4]MBN3927416.1 hypothetical protein [Nostoc sp. NMS4]
MSTAPGVFGGMKGGQLLGLVRANKYFYLMLGGNGDRFWVVTAHVTVEGAECGVEGCYSLAHNQFIPMPSKVKRSLHFPPVALSGSPSPN